MQSKPWHTPFWIMFVVLLFLGIGIYSWATIDISIKGRLGQRWFLLIFWPCVVVVEMALYWVMRKRLTERKLIWAHLIFSLFGYVILNFLMVLLSYLSATFNILGPNPNAVYGSVNFIGYWGSVLIGHTFFIVAMVRIFSAKPTLPPNDDNDLLSEITV